MFKFVKFNFIKINLYKLNDVPSFLLANNLFLITEIENLNS